MEISKFDGFRVEIDESNHRADIILSRPPLNVVLFSQRKVMANQFYELDRNKRARSAKLRVYKKVSDNPSRILANIEFPEVELGI